MLAPDVIFGGLIPELRLPVYEELDVFLEDNEFVRETVEAFEELLYRFAGAY